MYIPVIKTITERPKHKPWLNKSMNISIFT